MNDISTMIKIMEYMALGKPIVQFDSKEGRFSAREASLYADKVNQVPDFAAKILWLLDHPDERQKMGEFGRMRVERELAWGHSVEHLLAAYKRVFSKGSRSKDRGHEKRGELDRIATPANGVQTGAVQVTVNDDNCTRTYPSYVLVTPARNEQAFIEKTIQSLIHQTLLPLKWVIVDDASTDRTAEIVSSYLTEHPWIELVQMPQRRDRSFAAKASAFKAGYERLSGISFDIIGNLDGDISFDKDHFEFLALNSQKTPLSVWPGRSSARRGTVQIETASRGVTM
jgi:hypothetical protein